MKKLFTVILAAAATISFASAQSFDHKSIAYNDHQKINNHQMRPFIAAKRNKSKSVAAYYFGRQKEIRLEKINRGFNKKTAFVKHNRFLSKPQKNRQIQMLQAKRKNEISKVQFQYAKNDHQAVNRHFGHQEHK